MAEEKKEEKTEKKKEEAPKTAESGPKRTKLSRLSLGEVEEAIKKCQEKMGGLNSHYARFLLRRKQILSR